VRKALLLVPLLLFSCSSAQKKVSVNPTPLAMGKSIKEEKPLEVTSEFKAKPIYVPPEVVRVLIYPYEDENGILHQGEYLYFTLRDGYWTIATKAKTVEVKKFVSIVRTQRALDSREQKPQVPAKIEWVRPLIRKSTVPSEMEGGKPTPPISSPKTPETGKDERLKVLRDYLKRK